MSQKTLVLEDQRPDLEAVFAAIPMTGQIDADGVFSASSDPLLTHRIFGQVTSSAAELEVSGEAIHRIFASFLVELCRWSETFSGPGQP